MRLLNYIHELQANPLDLKKESLRKNFCRNLTGDEVKSLHDYDKFHQKVLEELKGKVSGAEEMTIRLENYLDYDFKKTLVKLNAELKQVYATPGSANVESVNVSLLNPKTWTNSSWTYQNEAPVLTKPSVDLDPIVAKLSSVYPKSINNNVYTEISEHLRSNSCHSKLEAEVFDHYLQGIQNCDLTTWSRLSEPVTFISNFLENQLSMLEVSILLEYCISNEKFVFLLIYPYFFKPLKRLLWAYLYPIFSLTTGSFTFFLKQVALRIGDIIKNKSAIIEGLHHLKVSRSAKITIGTGGISSLFLLYNKYILKDNTAIIPLYTGMGGFIGQFASDFRSNGSKFIFEITKTASTFTNAAVAGFLEPKQDAVRQVIRSFMNQKK